MNNRYPLDLIVLVPGKDEKETIDALLTDRQKSLGIRKIAFEIKVHPRRDPGCRTEAPDILQPYINRAAYALVIFDHEGCGREESSAQEVADELKIKLAKKGWHERNNVLVIEPELEAWVWNNSPHVDEVLGWTGRRPNLRSWLANESFWPDKELKPPRPKEALKRVLYETRTHFSASIFRQLAQDVSLEGCRDRVFNELKTTFKTWFSAE